MNASSAVSVAFDPLLGWTVLAVLGGIGPFFGSLQFIREQRQRAALE